MRRSRTPLADNALHGTFVPRFGMDHDVEAVSLSLSHALNRLTDAVNQKADDGWANGDF